MAAVSMVGLILSWGWTRLIALPFCIFKLAMSPMELGNFAKYIFIYLLSCMNVLHFHWFRIFISIIMKFIYEGEAEDTCGKTECEDDTDASVT